MLFLELLNKCDEEKLVKQYLLLKETSDSHVEQKIREVIDDLKYNRIPVEFNMTMVLEKGVTEDGEEVDIIFLRDNEEEDNVYSFEGLPWGAIMGCEVEEKSLTEIGSNERFAALVLFEMTYFGYSDEDVQLRIAKMLEEEASPKPLQ
ncbi:DUF6557 family protein [uncultured Ruminococcus sp.]|uniref:DUF6557 family protein n=1 Tax=uncultured Ruminococcus sp. TaxID=165186 RepID=UPI0026667ACA|nr:DUF6557 family protein [uncultured Ruminococcus sp.]